MYKRIYYYLNIAGISLITLSIPSIAAQDEQWQLAKDKQGIKVFTRKVRNSTYKAFKAETILSVGQNQLLALMDDTAACTEWLYKCKFSALVKKLSNRERFTYTINDMPWPVTDRAVLIHSTIKLNNTNHAVTITMNGMDRQALPENLRNNIPQLKNNIAVSFLQGTWTFTPMDNNRTQVVYQMHAELGGSLPASLVNALLVDNPFESLLNMAIVAKKEKYLNFKPF